MGYSRYKSGNFGKTFAGLLNPTTAPTLSSISTGGTVVPGTYTFKYTYTNTLGETLPSSSQVITIAAALAAPTWAGSPFSNAVTTGGLLLGSTTYYYKISTTNALGETLVGTEQSYAVPAGTNTNQITLNWNAVATATGYKIYRSTTSGSYGASSLLATIGSGATVNYADTGTTGAGQPAGSNTTSTNTNTITLTAPALPTGASGTNAYLTAGGGGTGKVGNAASNIVSITSLTTGAAIPATNTTGYSVGFTLYNADGTVNVARTTTGVAELPPGSGIYGALVSIPGALQGCLVFDTGGANPTAYTSENINPTDLSAMDSPVAHFGTAQAGGASTITLAASASATDGHYVGCMVYVVDGTGANRGGRTIVGYVGATKVSTLDRAWDAVPDNTSVYSVAYQPGPMLDATLKITPIDADGITFAKWMRVMGSALVNTAAVTGNTVTMYARDGTTVVATLVLGATPGVRTSSTIS